MENIGACGDDCSFCLRYKATKSNNADDLNRVKEIWISLGWRTPDIDAQELKCSGCCKENKCAYPKLLECVLSKNLKNCGLCKDYPCILINEAFVKIENVFKSIKYIPEKDLLIKAFGCKKLNLDKIHNSKH
jgi:hypothetical protein